MRFLLLSLFLILNLFAITYNLKDTFYSTPSDGDLFIDSKGNTYELISCGASSTSCLSSSRGLTLNILNFSFYDSFSSVSSFHLDFEILLKGDCVVGYLSYGKCHVKFLCPSGTHYDSNLEKCLFDCPDEETFKKMVLDKCVSFDYVKNATCSTDTGDVNITCVSCKDIFNMQSDLCNSFDTVLSPDINFTCSQLLPDTSLKLDFNVSDKNCLKMDNGDNNDNNYDDNLSNSNNNDFDSNVSLDDDNNDSDNFSLEEPNDDYNNSFVVDKENNSTEKLNDTISNNSIGSDDKFIDKEDNAPAGKDNEDDKKNKGKMFSVDNSNLEELKKQTSSFEFLFNQYKESVSNVKHDLSVVMDNYNNAKELFQKPITFSVPIDSVQSDCISFDLFNRHYSLDPCPYLRIIAPIVQFVLTIFISLYFIFQSIKMIKD